MSEYGKQIKAFFYFMFKHFFEFDFWIRVLIELSLITIVSYIIISWLLHLLKEIRKRIMFIFKELFLPLQVRIYEKIAFSTNNPNWQDRANKIKDDYKHGRYMRVKQNNQKKSYAGIWFLIYVILVSWIIGFHYFGNEKRSSYEVFFLGENAILKMEEWTTNTLCKTDINTIPCFFHNKIEVE